MGQSSCNHLPLNLSLSSPTRYVESGLPYQQLGAQPIDRMRTWPPVSTWFMLSAPHPFRPLATITRCVVGRVRVLPVATSSSFLKAHIPASVFGTRPAPQTACGGPPLVGNSDGHELRQDVGGHFVRLTRAGPGFLEKLSIPNFRVPVRTPSLPSYPPTQLPDSHTPAQPSLLTP